MLSRIGKCCIYLVPITIHVYMTSKSSSYNKGKRPYLLCAIKNTSNFSFPNSLNGRRVWILHFSKFCENYFFFEKYWQKPIQRCNYQKNLFYKNFQDSRLERLIDLWKYSQAERLRQKSLKWPKRECLPYSSQRPRPHVFDNKDSFSTVICAPDGGVQENVSLKVVRDKTFCRT